MMAMTFSHTYKSEENLCDLFVFIGILLVIYVIYKVCLAPNVVPDPEESPPYGFRHYYMPNQDGGGFWSGAATGGLLGYLFGRGNNYNNYNTGWGTGRWGGSWFGTNRTSGSFFSSPSSGSSPSTGSRMTSGFGGTRRR